MNKIKLLALLITLILSIAACGKAQDADEVGDSQAVGEAVTEKADDLKSEDKDASEEKTEDSTEKSNSEKTKTDESEQEKVELEKVEPGQDTTVDRFKDGDFTVPEIDDTGREYSHNTVIVMVKEGTEESQIQQICDAYNLEIKYSYDTISGYSLSSKKELTDKELNELIKSINEYNFVLSAEKDYVVNLDESEAR
ncbi:MAG: hypothetical protein E7272_11345 [Pseudobutyrivibrio ruminis]|uniref:Uncharacterized protein n=1 Tax=Pseudobutyrivibrio ruminis TaxID=46206 RepID=A0A927UB44_9FIRM|nr:hypothetical protein [Pseudobutyrivibrio ruminis]